MGKAKTGVTTGVTTAQTIYREDPETWQALAQAGLAAAQAAKARRAGANPDENAAYAVPTAPPAPLPAPMPTPGSSTPLLAVVVGAGLFLTALAIFLGGRKAKAAA